MWLMVLYDLPTETKKQRKASAKFRKDLFADGFYMFQFSAYVRHNASKEALEVHKQRVKKSLPEEGLVGILEITDKQFERMEVFHCRKPSEKPSTPVQLELF
jgi:CRISPR-associated protein Cas2